MKNFFLGLAAIFIFTAVVYAEVPNEIRYTGRLKSYQALVNGTKQMNFKLYDSETNGTLLWASGVMSVSVTSGIFVSTLTPTFDLGTVSALWLEITIDNKTLSPREKIMAQAYALHSQSSEVLSVSSGEIQVKIGTSTAYIGISRNRMYVKSQTAAGSEYLGVPPGTVIAYAGSNIPVGYLPCDGRTLNISDYPELYSAIGLTYGGDASSFRLPDFRGMFLRGNGAYKDAIPVPHPSSSTISTVYRSAPLGQLQGDAIRNITGGFFAGGSGSTGAIIDAGSISSLSGSSVGEGRILVKFDSSLVVPVSNENIPVNYSVNYYIKY